MFTRVLTELERKQAKAYLKQDGEKTLNIRVLAIRAKKFLPQIDEDTKLLKQLIQTYERKDQ
jgi:hypothetical protein